MGKRREARERAVQFLFQHDLNPPENLDAALEEFWQIAARGGHRGGERRRPRGGKRWSCRRRPPRRPRCGCLPNRSSAARSSIATPLTTHIKKHAKNWELHRIAAVDRNILRLAIYEMLHREDIPPVVSINEAVDIAKKFSTQDSGKFVNGILDKVKGELMRPARVVK